MSKRNIKPKGLIRPEKTIGNNVVVEHKDELDIELIKEFADNQNLFHTYLSEHKGTNYSEIILLLIHKKYAESVAKRWWVTFVNHMKYLEGRLGREVGINVAAMDFLENFTSSKNSLRAITEAELDDFTRGSTKDELSRDIFDAFIAKLFDESIRDGSKVAYAIFNIDDFKQFNDTYGYKKGDGVLMDVGTIILENIREMDKTVRYSGEEIGIIFPDADNKSAVEIAERIRQKIEETFHSREMPVTVSCGVSGSKGKEGSDELIEAACSALYRAKKEEKNRVYTS